ncbi:hypothetical protein PMI28_00381 [Pseudomonas sp. GM48]|nr:hypothetical protein PMI28_00381 [Pseudomonas sp. GM48]
MRLSISANSAAPHCDAIAAHFSCGIRSWMESPDRASAISVESLLIEFCVLNDKGRHRF